MSHAILPPADGLGPTLSKLVGREVKAKLVKAATAPLPAKCYVGTYDDGAGNLEGLWLSDVALTAGLAACLTLIPAGVANEAVKAQKLSPELAENAREVANITANSFVGKRVRLVTFLDPGAALSPAITEMLVSKKQLREYLVEIAGYTGGKLWFVGHEPPAT